MARTSPPAKRGGQLGAAGGALAVVAVIVALPFLLIWAAGNPLPGIVAWTTHLIHDPGGTLTGIGNSLTRPDDGDLFLHVLSVVAWIAAVLAAWGWFTFLVAFAVELRAQLRSRRLGQVAPRSTRIPGMGLQQRAAAALVAAIIGVIAAPTLASAAIPAHGTAVASAAVAPDRTHAAAVQPTAGPAALSAAGKSYIEVDVQRGEGLLDIAERHGLTWQQVAEANYGITQTDGRSLAPGTMRVYPGWTLRIPSNATTIAAFTGREPTNASATFTAVTFTADPATPTAGPMTYRVARGDWLADISARFLGDKGRYAEIAALNPQLEHRDHRFPDHIEQGWTVVLPADAIDHGPQPHATGTVEARTSAGAGSAPAATNPPNGAPHDSGPGTVTGPGAPTGPGQATSSTSPTPTTDPSPGPAAAAHPSGGAAPTPSPMTTTSGVVSAAASAEAGAPTSHATPHHTADAAPTQPSTSTDDGVVVVGSLAAAGLLSALLLTAVLRRRRRQRQYRRPGRRLPHPRDGATERALKVAEQPADVDRLDHALRSLATDLGSRDSALPDIVAASIVQREVSVVLTAPCADPPGPWTADGAQWTLPADALLPAVDEQLAPLPTLVTVGSQTGRHLLLDLERLGSLSISGDPERAMALLRYLASELACNAWSDDVEVILAGWDIEEAELLVALNPDRVRAVSSAAGAAARLQRRVSVVTAALHAAAVSSTFAGRITDVGEAWTPQVLLVVNPDETDSAALRDLCQQLDELGGSAVAVAATVGPTGAIGQHAATVTADGVLHIALPFLRTQAVAAGLPRYELEPLAEIMAKARLAADEPVPAAAEPDEWAAGTDAAGAVLHLYDDGAPATAAAEPTTANEATAPRPPAGPAAPATTTATVTDDDWAAPVIPTVVTTPAAPGAEPDPVTAIPRVDLAAVSTPGREVTAAIRQRRRLADPQLDADLRAWRDRDPTRPRIGVLGRVEVAAPGPEPDQRRRFHAEIIVFLAQRAQRGATAEQLSDALWPEQNVRDGSRRVAITRARKWLGDTPDGAPWLPEMGSDRLYRIEGGYLLDWHLFRRLRSRGEAHGPAGAKDLRAALELVRGVPLDGADRAYAAGARNPFTWLPESDVYPGHLTSAIVDTAHQLAELYLDAGDTIGTRWAVQRAWLADPHRGDDEPWRDLMRAAQADGHNAEVRNLLGELMHAREAEIPEDLAKDTYAWLHPLLPDLLGARTSVG